MLWCRNVASRARWVEEAGAAEVLDNKGKLWLTTGIARGGKLYYNVEEIGFLAERGALVILDDKDETVGMEEIYGKIASGSYGCSWDAFQAYTHLKFLGYIVGRYDVPWTMKHICSGDVTNSPESMDATSQSFGKANGACNDITKLLIGMHIGGMYPSFKVHLPNSKFKKSYPGVPSFLVCLLSFQFISYNLPIGISGHNLFCCWIWHKDKPPSRDELETVENKFDDIPLKFCQVDNGRISFLSFDKVTLPSLP
ncbi:hypothetical protein CFC21_078385 [Triticum aestivum]|uniref:tRNA-splicing endonuclease subunit Sen54 N-terminal domain-containing protein n=2 Tax=Triticum aestivum TaxID=4565 RepID=A0A9R1L0T5_WHEAT|nr:hypothetical protein CFC21_078385 [Triticum aestivum]